MRWRDMRRSDNVEDRRGMSMGGAGIKLGGGALLLIVVLSLLTGTNPLDLLSGLEEASPPAIDSGPERKPPADDPQSDFIRAILGDTEDTWSRLFGQGGGTYEPPRLVLFSGAVQSACGQASAAVGPFYCPPDRRVYLDLQFFQELSERFGAPGDFARAYVVAHEIGHHVQNLLGVSERVQRQRARVDQASANALSVRLELQADCYAGSGATPPRGATSSSRATSRPPWRRRRRSETIAYRSSRAGTSCPSRSPTAHPPSVSGGSGPASRRGTCGAATRSWPGSSGRRGAPLGARV